MKRPWGLIWLPWLFHQGWKPRRNEINWKKRGFRSVPCFLFGILGRDNLAKQPHPPQDYYQQNKMAAWGEKAKEGSVTAGLKLPWLLCSRLLCPGVPSRSRKGMRKVAVESEKPLGSLWDDPREDAAEHTWLRHKNLQCCWEVEKEQVSKRRLQALTTLKEEHSGLTNDRL